MIAFLLCLALLTSDATVTNATSVDTTDIFAEISTEMLNETKKCRAGKAPGRKEMCQIQMEQEIQKKVRNTENSESTKVTSNTENTETTEAIKNTEVTGNTEVTESTEAAEAIEETEKTEETEQPELKNRLRLFQ